jgi:hypothetical protein
VTGGTSTLVFDFGVLWPTTFSSFGGLEADEPNWYFLGCDGAASDAV